jgi:hypothetical protein
MCQYFFFEMTAAHSKRMVGRFQKHMSLRLSAPFPGGRRRRNPGLPAWAVIASLSGLGNERISVADFFVRGRIGGMPDYVVRIAFSVWSGISCLCLFMLVGQDNWMFPAGIFSVLTSLVWMAWPIQFSLGQLLLVMTAAAVLFGALSLAIHSLPSP